MSSSYEHDPDYKARTGTDLNKEYLTRRKQQQNQALLEGKEEENTLKSLVEDSDSEENNIDNHDLLEDPKEVVPPTASPSGSENINLQSSSTQVDPLQVAQTNQSQIKNSDINDEDDDNKKNPEDPDSDDDSLQELISEMSFDSKIPSIEKLGRANYDDWAIRMQSSLCLRNWWIDPNLNLADLTDPQKIQNQQAGNFLVLNIDHENLMMLVATDYSNFLSSWNKLKSIHRPRSIATLAELYGNITHARHRTGNPINNHLIYLQTQFAMIAEIDTALTEHQKVAFIQGTLRSDPDFGELIRSSNWLEQKGLTVHRVCEVLNAACQHRSTDQRNEFAASSKRVRNFSKKFQRNGNQSSTRKFACQPCRMDNHSYDNCYINNPTAIQRRARSRSRRAACTNDEHQSDIALPNISQQTVNSVKDRLGYIDNQREKYPNERTHSSFHRNGTNQLNASNPNFSHSHNLQITRNDFPNISRNTIELHNNNLNSILITDQPSQFSTFKSSLHKSHSERWLVDSGATVHMCNNQNYYTKLFPQRGFITIADGTSIPTIGIGEVTLKVNSNNEIYTLDLYNVLLVPSLNESLVSVNNLTRSGSTIEFTHNKCILKDKNINFTLATRTTSQYYIDTLHQHSANVCIHEWHRRMAHRNLDSIKRMKLKTSSCTCSSKCIGCLGGKLNTKPFPLQSEKPASPLQVVVTDICGPLPTTSITGSKYFMTLIDAHSDYTHVFFLKNKHEAKGIIMDFVAYCNNIFNRSPQIIRSDRGGEYLDNSLQQFLKQKGIIFQCTVHDSPQQNGIAERKNRTLMEAVRSMLIQRKLPNYLWAEALKNANYTFNRITRNGNTLTPFELFFGKTPSPEFHEFGSEVYFSSSPQERKKLDPRGLPGLFMGIDSNSKGYRVFANNSVRVERNVIFLSDTSKSVPKSKENSLNEIPIEPNAEKPSSPRRSERLKLQNKACATVDDPLFTPTTYKQAINCPHREQWLNAMQEEITSIEANNTWKVVDAPNDRSPIGCKWVYKLKLNDKGEIERYKARLVVQGFSQIHGVDYDEVFAPVAHPATFRIFLAIAGLRNYSVKQYDVKAAFLNGTLDEDIFMKMPPGSETSSKVLKLQKSLYGLKQAARQWNQAFHTCLQDIGFAQSTNDSCLYSITQNSSVSYLIMHVDDILIASDQPSFINELADKINAVFEIKCLGNVNEFLGIKVTRNDSNIFEISQSSYIKKIANEFQLSDCKGSKYPIDPGYYKLEDEKLLTDNSTFRKLIGMLLYVSINTRPDIAAAVNILAQRVSKPRHLDHNEGLRIIKYLMSTINHKLILGDNNSRDTPLISYSDANWAECRETRTSTSGYLSLVYGGVVSWFSRKQNVIALSTTESEYYALTESAKEIQWIRRLLCDFHISVASSTTLYSDSQSCIKMVTNEKFSNRTKHIDTKYKYINKAIKDNIISLTYCPTEKNLADMLTKPLAGIKIKFLRELGHIL